MTTTETKTKIILLIIILFGILIRFDIGDRPMQFNEGIFAYVADNMLNHNMRYLDIYDSKPPGIYYIFMFFMKIFGNKPTTFHLVTVISDIIIIFLIYLIASRLFNKNIALLSSAIYSILFTSYILSMGGFLEPPMMVFTLLSIYFYIKGTSENKFYYLFLAGIFLGLSFMIKQPAIILFMTIILHSLFLVYFNKIKIRRIIIDTSSFLIGFLSVIIPIIILLIRSNKLYRYLFSVYYSNLGYGPGVSVKLNLILDYVLNTHPIFTLLSLLAIICLYRHINNYNIGFLYSWLIPIILFMLFASDFQPHYLLQIMPVMAIFLVLLYNNIKRIRYKKIVSSLIVIMFIINIFYIFFDLRALHTAPAKEKNFYDFIERTYDFGIISDFLYDHFKYRVHLLFLKHRSAYTYSSLKQQQFISDFLKKNMNSTDKFLTTTPAYGYLTGKKINYRFFWITPMIAEITDLSDFPEYASQSKYFLYEFWQEEEGYISKSFLDCIKRNWKLIENIDNWHTHVYENTNPAACKNAW